MGIELIRIQGSAISSGKGISDEFRDIFKQIIKFKKCPVMLDGGIGEFKMLNKYLILDLIMY